MKLLALWMALAHGAGIESCDDLRSQDAEARAAWRCYYQVARGGAYDEVVAHLRPLVEAPDAPAWAVHTWASLMSDVADPSTGEAMAAAQAAQDDRGDLTGRVFIRLNRGLHLADHAALDEGASLIREAAELAAAEDHEGLWATARLQEARLLWKAGVRLDEVEVTVREMLALDSLEYQAQAVALMILRGILEDTGRHAEVLHLLRRWESQADEAGDTFQSEIVRLRRLDQLRRGADPAAMPDPEWVREVEALIARDLSNPSVAISGRERLALALAAHEPDRALELADEAVRRAREAEAPHWELNARTVRAEVRGARGDAGAYADLERALELNDVLEWTDLPRGILWSRARVAELLGDREAALAHSLEALEGVEAEHATAEDLVRARFFGRYGGWYAQTAIRAWEAQQPGVAVEVLERQVALQLRERLGLAARPTGLEEIQGILREGEVLLYAVLPEQGPGGWLQVWRDRVDFSGLPPAHDLEARIGLFVGALHSRDEGAEAAARRLYDEVLADVLRTEPERLLVVAAGALHHLPFAALQGPDGELVGDRVEVYRVPSATWWASSRERRPAEGERRAVVVADPLVGREAGLPALPRARQERAAAERWLGRAVIALEGAEATQRAWRQATGGAALIHVAAHAVLDPVHPHRTALMLAPGEGEDGRLTAEEVVGAPLDGPVVVLSACRSADGPVVGGEGPMGLSRAFLHAGAGAVVGTLWPVRDDEAADLAEALLMHLSEGLAIGEALTAVRRERVAAGAPVASWAGLVLIGDPDRVPFPGGVEGQGAPWSAMVGWILGVLGLGLLSLVWLRR